MSTETATVRVTTRDGVAYVTLDAPPLNILTTAMMRELTAALDRVAHDDSLKAVAITANGKAFSAGADVGEHAPSEVRPMIGAFGELFRRLDALDVPVVMAVDGAALGAGFELVMMADVLLASERATFGQPEIRLGFFAPVAVVRLPALVGPARAAEITASGRIYDAAAMRELGLVARVVPQGELDGALEATLDDFRRASPLVMRMNMRALRLAEARPFAELLTRAERRFLEELMITEDVQEGLAAFTEKRKPIWKNR